MPVGGFFSNSGWSGGSRLASGGGGFSGYTGASSWAAPEQSNRSQTPSAPGGAPTPLPSQMQSRLNGTPTSPNAYPELYALYQQQQQQPRRDSMIDSILAAQYGPDKVNLATNLGANQRDFGMTVEDIKRQQANAQRNAALDQQMVDLQRAAANGDLSAIPKMRALAAQQLANQRADFTNKEAQARDAEKRGQWDLRSQLTARGAFNTVANERGTGRLQRDLYYNMAGIGNQRTQADISYKQGQLGFDEQERKANERLASIGLDGQRISEGLRQGMEAIGMGGYATLTKINDALSGNDSQAAALAAQMAISAAQYQGIPLDVLQAYFPQIDRYLPTNNSNIGGSGYRNSNNYTSRKPRTQ